jgi:hypothetical protein
MFAYIHLLGVSSDLDVMRIFAPIRLHDFGDAKSRLALHRCNRINELTDEVPNVD